MPTVLVTAGTLFDVRAWGTDAQCALLEFLQNIKAVEAADRQAIVELLAYSADYGPPVHNKAKCRAIGDGILEFKARRGARVLWFYAAGSIIVCTHGFVKKQQKTPQSEIARARAIHKAFLEEST